MNFSLTLYEKLLVSSTTRIANLTRHAPNWARSIRAVGGYWQGDFTIKPNTMPIIEMIDFFNRGIGRRIVEDTHGITTWEGEIVQMDLTLDGITYRRTMDSERWHNRVKVAYTDNATNIATATAWSEDTDSSDVYGESEYIDLVGSNYSATVAEALRDRRLAENAFPKSVPVGGLTFARGITQRQDSLRVNCAGYVFGMNRRYRESDIAAANVSTQISTLVGNSEFVTAGSIDTNALSVPVKCSDISQRLWDVIEELILMGDGSGNRWVGGVHEDRKFDYNLAETAVTHYWRDGRLLNKASAPVVASMIKPDIVVRISGAPIGVVPPGGDVIDNPRNVWIEEVEFIAPDGYRLIPYGGGYEILESQHVATG